MATTSSGIAGYVQGLKEAKAAFQALPEIMRTRLLVATETTLSEIVRHAKSRIQSNPSIQTRSLLNSINYSLTKTNGRGRVGVSTGQTTLTVAGRKIRVKGLVTAGQSGSALTSRGAKVIRPSRYAHLIEFGSRRQSAEPFMIPAAQSQERPYLDRCMREGKNVEKDVEAIGMRNL